ncbi:flavin-containing monooxygenase [Pseudomonas sp. R11F]|uniref:NAD(P)/FAD-dependent oxidoreductase n=1 Tax=Pseudomonas palleroniana TaxID=191390 RepID=A0A1H5NU84_9PSED|nr:NAD(P)/FAD-dependent oxidoreductase [Pseudomonas palleroniana]KAB0570348.1 NAD(P)/FAD-dependent oxidoreductase [Pseudomonas palleroniana]PTC30368.1 NAD(P)/FAD-dependent oxidoreductase [Pseudomonas palleroniana]SEF04327.1 Predicted flavoprotein CzcO associated with the cation diffusion facilitator CzcD [Pseudomonas palleroniana]
MNAYSDAIDIAIIGSGFAGLCMAIKLKEAGVTDFLIAEQAETLGGTWRDNHYPGCACDVQSHVYSFSFAPNPDWTRQFAPQPEIRAYLEHCARRYELASFLRFGMGLQRAVFDEQQQRWQLSFSNGRHINARVLISGMGGLSRPALPDIPGLDSFKGKRFHSQQWDHAYSLRGKRVAVIGTGASAIQFVPQIAPLVAHLQLFQRTPPWIMPKPDRNISRFERWAFKHLPFTQRLVRGAYYWALEGRVLGFARHPRLMKMVQKIALRHLHKQVTRPSLRKTLTPDYTIGCKRVLISNDYYPALSRSNVEVITDSVLRIEADGVITRDGIKHPADCLIFGTGFQATDPLPRDCIIGRDGIDLMDTWREGAHAYKGTTVPGYPNLFLIVGPNTGLGHNSMILMIEAQVSYILDALKQMRRHHIATVDIKPAVEDAYNRRLQDKLKRTIWNTGGCRSWYLDPRTGKNTTLWPGSTWRFKQVTRQFALKDYVTHPIATSPSLHPVPAPHSRAEGSLS